MFRHINEGPEFCELVSAVHLAHLGDAYLSPEVFAALLPGSTANIKGSAST